MRCTTCGGATEIRETRAIPGVFANKRTRVCSDFPSHRFVTYEITAGAWGYHRIELKKVAARIAGNILRFRRDLDVVRQLDEGRQGKDIAADLGLAPSIISHIKKKMGVKMRTQSKPPADTRKISESGQKALETFWMK